jgi:hypothetical protein
MENDNYRKYFSIRAVNHIIEYGDDGQENVTKKYYEFAKCGD